MLSVKYKPFKLSFSSLSVIMLNVIELSVVMLIIVAPTEQNYT
jgi:hypothetical protein